MAKIKRVNAYLAKPYDAEIEYLESTGTQWIDTGITFTDFDSATMGFVVAKSISTNRCVIGAYVDDSTAPKFQIFVSNTQNVGFLSGIDTITGLAYNQRVTTGTKYDISFTTTVQAYTSINVFVFARNNDRGNLLQFNGLRVYSLFMQKDSLSVRDFIPVRVGTTGYMYDKVSKQLFGNQGTGSFILGPDKRKHTRIYLPSSSTLSDPSKRIVPSIINFVTNKYSVKDYVQDGLVAMWDGIDNTGGGHDMTATVWKDLVAQKAFTLTSSGKWGDNCLVCDGTAQAATMPESVADQIFENKPQWEAVFQLLDVSRVQGGVFSTRTSSNSTIPGRISLGKNFGSGMPIQFIIQRRTNLQCDSEIHSCSVNYTGRNSVVAGYMDGSLLTYLGNDGGGDFGWGGFIGARTGNYNPMSCKLFCIRIYNRALTSAEIAANYAVDKLRFNFPD